MCNWQVANTCTENLVKSAKAMGHSSSEGLGETSKGFLSGESIEPSAPVRFEREMQAVTDQDRILSA